MTNKLNLIDPTVRFLDGKSEGELIIQHTQEIPQVFLDELKEARNESGKSKMGNFHRFASIPTAVYEQWLREGFDATREGAAKVMAKLRAEGLDYFITTEKKL